MADAASGVAARRSAANSRTVWSIEKLCTPPSAAARTRLLSTSEARASMIGAVSSADAATASSEAMSVGENTDIISNTARSAGSRSS